MKPVVRAALDGLIAEWDAFIGSDEEDDHNDVILVGERIGELRKLIPLRSAKQMTDAELLAELVGRGVLLARGEEVTQKDASGQTIMVALHEWYETERTVRIQLERPILLDDVPKPYHELARRLIGD